MSDNKEVMNEFQPSMTEWFAMIGEEKESAAFRKEDNTKDERIRTLNEVIGLPYEQPTDFPAQELADASPAFTEYLEAHGGELCALRLIPNDPSLPKLRNRGLSVKEVYEGWFKEQKLDYSLYTASFRPHAGTYPWSFILIVNWDGAYGEMIHGQHAQLTHGDTKSQSTQFHTDFKGTWKWHNRVDDAEVVVRRLLAHVEVRDEAKRKELTEKLDAEFVHNHLVGYFEAILWPDDVLRFSDYNRLLHTRIPAPVFAKESLSGLRGTVAFKGVVRGTARIVNEETVAAVVFNQGDILVTNNTDIRFVPLMQKAGAILTDRGGMLSHASIIARELKVPCIVGMENISTAIKDGDLVEVNADLGVVTKLT